MTQAKKILILGDYEGYSYHPFEGVDVAMKNMLPAYDITCTGDYTVLEQLGDYDLFISYTDCWKRENAISDAQAAGLISYVANGGKLLLVHCGLSFQVRSELISMMGGKFVRHPQMTELLVKAVTDTTASNKEPITADLTPFRTVEEPYQFSFDDNVLVTMLTEYELDGKTFPHSWKKKYCKGEVIFLMGGHTVSQIEEDGNRTLFCAAVNDLLS